MDNLSVSVVPPQRAGMATGIFSTVRVAGEGVALASVASLFSQLLSWQLTAHNQPAALAGQLASYHLVDSRLLGLAEQAFQQLLLVLMAMTLLCAAAIWRCLVTPDRK
ncbi:hypothetical protein [Erwinia aphidicola]